MRGQISIRRGARLTLPQDRADRLVTSCPNPSKESNVKLYYTAGACSLAPHIVLHEIGAPFETSEVDLSTKRTKSGGDYKGINPKGAVPALQLDNGEVLTEGATIIQYLADKNPGSKLAPAAGTMERYRLQEWLNYIATEIHKGFGPLFNSKLSDDAKQVLKDALTARFDFLVKNLEGKDYLMGSQFTVADAYLFTVLGWTRYMNIDLGKWPVLKAYVERVGARPAVEATLKAEAQTAA
jgi:glutathione S-transferase